MRPIPKRLLIHAVILKTPAGIDSWQKVQYLDQSLEHVRIDPAEKIIQTRENTQVQLNSVLFYDCRNSAPAGITFEAGQKVVWCGREYTIVSIERLYDASRLHHWEVGLV
nr:MAG TPA: Minor capsid protein [Caudoviricetes sp.]